MNSQKLLQNMIDQMKEAQLKLGYVKETIRLYFAMDSLNAILQTDYGEEEILEALQAQSAFRESVLGELQFALHEHRIEVRIPPQGAQYVHENVPSPSFLKSWISLFYNNHHLTIEQIENMVKSFGKEYVCKKMSPDSDFDYVIFFTDQSVDPYYYCIKMEMGHTIYHRFMEKDYEQLME